MMNCNQVRDHLAAVLYGDVPAEIASAIQAHIAACPACRQQHAALRQVRELLNRAPAPKVEVDVGRIYRDAADRQERRARRWRRVALAGVVSAAAVLLIAVGLRFKIRVEQHQFTLRWSEPTQESGVGSQESGVRSQESERRVAATNDGPRTTDKLLSALTERLNVATELIHALAADVEERDRDQQQRITWLRARLVEVQRQTALWRQATEDDFRAFYIAQFPTEKKGEKQ